MEERQRELRHERRSFAQRIQRNPGERLCLGQEIGEFARLQARRAEQPLAPGYLDVVGAEARRIDVPWR